MFTTRRTTYARQILTAFSTINAEPPKALTEATAQADAVLAAIQQPPVPDALPAAVLAALDAGTDPAADPEVQRLVTATTITAAGGISDAVMQAANARLGDVFAANADATVAAWSPVFNRAATDLLRAKQVLGTTALDDTAAVLAGGAAAAAAWTSAQAAIRTIDTIRSGWLALSQIVGMALEPRYVLLQIADVDVSTWLEQGLTGRRMSPWEALDAGLPLALLTPDEHRERMHAIELEAERRQQKLIDA